VKGFTTEDTENTEKNQRKRDELKSDRHTFLKAYREKQSKPE
jgi:hypothetical protein